jgi:hypothetical protein
MPAPHHRKPFPMRLATGHATAERITAGVSPRTSGRTTRESLTSSVPRPWAVNCSRFRKSLGASRPQPLVLTDFSAVILKAESAHRSLNQRENRTSRRIDRKCREKFSSMTDQPEAMQLSQGRL